jgi:hypothetical protein
MHPVETIKTVQQISTSAVLSQRDVLRGRPLHTLFNGLGVSVVGSLPASTLYFATYEFAQTRIFRDASFVSNFAAGFLAEIVSTSLYIPVDIVKQHYQVTAQNSNRTAMSMLRSIYEGTSISATTAKSGHQAQQTTGIRNFYRGFGATLLCFGPYSALYFSFFDYLRSIAQPLVLVNNDTTWGRSGKEFGLNLACGVAAGGLAAFLTNPLDLLKLRLQMSVAPSLVNGAISVIRQEGLVGLMKGAPARVMFMAPSAGIAMAAYETVKTALSKVS